MKRKAVYPKVAGDLFFAQGGWSIWFLGIITIVHIVKAVVAFNTGSPQEDFYGSSTVSSNIYIFIIGIIGAYAFLPMYVQNGVTRKDYFKGAILAVIGLSVAIVLFSVLLTGLEYLLVKYANLPVEIDNSKIISFDEDGDDNIIATIVKMMVVSPYVSLSGNWLLSLVVSCFNLITSYFIGWLIGAGYYRYGWFIGLGFIGLSIVFMMSWDMLWGIEVSEPLSTWIGVGSWDLPVLVSFLGSFAIIGIILTIIRTITRKVIVKL